MYAMLPVEVCSKNLPGSDFRVLVALIAYKGKNNEAWPSVSRLVEMTGMAQSNVSRALTSLEKSGMIAREKMGTRNLYTFPCLDHPAQNLDMVDHAPVIAKSATTESVPTQPIPAAPVRTVSEGAPKTETVALPAHVPATADNPSPVEQSGNSGMLPEPPASVPPEAKPTQLPAIVMAENAKPHNVSDEFMQELNARPIVAPKPVDDASLRARALRLQALQAENSARSRAEKLAERGAAQDADKADQDSVTPEPALATTTPADNLPPVTKTEGQAVKTEGLAAEPIAQPAPDTTAPIILPAPVVVHESQESAPQAALPTICAPQGELLSTAEQLPVVAKTATTAKRASRLPDDWRLPRSWGEWAMQETGMTADAVRWEADKFADYWHARSGQGACKLDWQATWRNWIRKNAEQGGYAPPREKSKMTQALDNLVNTNFDWDDQASWNPFYYPTPDDAARKRDKAEHNKDVK